MQRRKTYTVRYTRSGEFVTHVHETGIKCYDTDFIARWAERFGYTVLSIEPRARRKPGEGKRWEFDQAAVDAIKDFLGITWPVYITVGSGRRTIGYAQACFGWQLPRSAPLALRESTLVHRVVVSGVQSAESASRTFWHELAHCMQHEYAAASAPVEGRTEASSATARMHNVRVWHRQQNAVPYSIRPCEVEATSYEQYATEIIPCIPA